MFSSTKFLACLVLLASTSLTSAAARDSEGKDEPRYLRQRGTNEESGVERRLVNCALPSGVFRLKHNSRWLQMEDASLAGIQYMIKASKNKDGSTTKWSIENSNKLKNKSRGRYAKKDTSGSNNRFKGGTLDNAEAVIFQATNNGSDCTNVKIKVGDYWLEHDGGESNVKSVNSGGTTWTIV